MPSESPWTPKRVAEALIVAYGVRSGQPVLSDSGRFTVGGHAVSAYALDAMDWPRSFVTDQQDRRVLRLWASCIAQGVSVRQRHADYGWDRSWAERRRRVALDAIADALNRANNAGHEGP